MSDFMTPDDVSKILGCSTQTLYNWRQKGIGPNYVKHGKFIRYTKDDLREWWELTKTDHDRDAFDKPMRIALTPAMPNQ